MNYLSGPSASLSMGHGGAGSQKEFLHVVLVALRRWCKIAVPIGLLLAMAAMATMVMVVKPRYTAATWIEIRERPEAILSSGGGEDARKYVQNQLELLRSPIVIDRVTANPQVAETPELADKRDPSQTLRSSLRIRPMGQSDYFVIEFTSLAPEKAALVANEVAAAYLDIQDRHDSQRTQKLIDLLKQQQANQQQIVQTHRDNVRVLALDRTGRDPFATDDPKGRIQLRNPLADVQTQLINYEAQQIQLQAEIQSFEEMLSRETFDPPADEVQKLVALDPHVAAFRELIRANHVSLELYRTRGANLENNPQYQKLLRDTTDAEEAVKKAHAESESEV